MLSWTFIQNEVGSLLIGRYTVETKAEVSRRPAFRSTNQIKIASFDLDSTLISTKSNSLHATDSHDWTWWHPTVAPKLRLLSSQGYTIIMFTNQGRLTTTTGSQAKEMSVFKDKIEAIAEELGVPFTLYAACANDGYRKPRTGMWDFLRMDLGLLLPVHLQEFGAGRQVREEGEMDVFMVGDAAGRETDHSDCDVHFCENLGILFFTPEEFFLGDKTQVSGHKFHPSWYLPASFGGSSALKPVLDPPIEYLETQLIVLVGLPGSGKSTYYRRFLQPRGFERLAPLELDDSEECVQAAERYLLEGKSIVIDGINSTIATRSIWVSLAQKYGIQARALNFTTPVDLCLHNDAVRALGGPPMNLEKRGIFARTPFRKLQTSFEKPATSEGFADVLEVHFEWAGSDDELNIWRRHWL